MVSDLSYISKLPPAVAKAHPILSNNTSQTEEIWSRILQEVSSKNNNEAKGSVIFLGNNQSGKSSLINRMTNGERQNNSSVLEYNYLTVHADPDGSYAYQLGSGTGLGPSDFVNLPLWTLDGKEELAPLLKFAFPPQLAKCAIVLCASLEQPGNILPSLRKWYSIIEEQIRAFYSREEVEQAKQAQVRFWQEYVEPIESSSTRLEIDPVLLPPEQGVLDENCGASIIVAITKSDAFAEIGTDIDKVQFHVRQFCLQHGAALIYTSAKEEKNTQLLLKYLSHRVFLLPFTHLAYIVENDSIFVPSGWDSEQKLDIVKETLSDLEVPLLLQDDIFSQRERLRADQLVESEDEQAFLQRMYAALADGNSGGSAVSGVSPKRNDLQSQASGTSSGTKSPMNLAQVTGDSNTLASFFNSLLNNNTINSSSRGSNLNNLAANHVDAEAHLQKILNKPQVVTSAPTNASGDAKFLIDGGAGQQDDDESDISSTGSVPTPRNAAPDAN